MNIEVPCELYARLSAIPMTLDLSDERKYFKSLFLERQNNTLFAVVTNGKLAAIERIGENDGPDEFTAIVIDPALIAQCETEIKFNSFLVIVANDTLAYTSIKTTFGYNYPGNAMVQLPEKNYFNTWREWAPDEMPKKTFGAMFWFTQAIYTLATASPTGGLCFPEFIDTTVPVVVRDKDNADWFGLFMPTTDNGEKIDPASRPGWL